MNIKMTIKDVCANIPHIELEENVDIKDIEKVLDTVKKIATDLADERGPRTTPIHDRHVVEPNHSTATPRAELPPVPAKDFIPASDVAMRALYGACRSNGTDVSAVCKQYGVDPDNISKDDCRRMTSDLNDKSGYSKIQQPRQQYNRDTHRFPRADRYPDDSDVFGNAES